MITKSMQRGRARGGRAVNDDDDGWKFAALVAGACAIGAMLVIVLTAIARHV